MRFTLCLSALLALSTGCTELGVVGAPCDNERPCNDGLECLAGACEELNNVVDQDAGEPPIVDAGKKIPPDGGRDAGIEDAGDPVIDAGPLDGGAVDAGPDTVCGDGIIEGAEGCDDENTSDNDGCSSACAVEDGFECYGLLKSYCASAAAVTPVVECTDFLDTDGERLYLIQSPLLECLALNVDNEKKIAIGMTSPPPELRLSTPIASNGLSVEGGGELILVNLQLSTTGNTERLLHATDEESRLVLDQVLVGPTDDIAVEVEDASVHIRRTRFTATHGGLSLNTVSAIVENTSFVGNGLDGEDSEFGAIRILATLDANSRLEGLTVVNNRTTSATYLHGVDCDFPAPIGLSLVLDHDGEDATAECAFEHSFVETVAAVGTNFDTAPVFSSAPELTGPPALVDTVDAFVYPALIFDLDGRRRGPSLTVGARETP